MATRSKNRATSRRIDPRRPPQRVTASATRPAAPTVALTVTIDTDAAERLWTTMTSGRILRQQHRFEQPSGGYYHHDQASRWDAGRTMWCHSALEALVLADYERACGYQVLMLWDLYYHPGNVVVSTRPTPDYMVPAGEL